MIDEKKVEEITENLRMLQCEIHYVIFGQHEAVKELILGLIAGGHVLLEGVPGLAKTLIIRTLSQVLDLTFKRIQFTPDLMPSDVLGTEILSKDPKTGSTFFKFSKGPIFANIVLADEINRTPPKTQAALLEAMQEFEVTYAGKTYVFDLPFFLLATQNPVEQSGTYPLPEAQVDRFLLHVNLDYPKEEDENHMLLKTTGSKENKVKVIMKKDELLMAQKLVRDIYIDPVLVDYINRLVRGTRPQYSTDNYIISWVRWGASPRAGQALVLTAKAHALLNSRYSVTMEDIISVAYPVLRHRILMNYKANFENVYPDNITAYLLETTALKKPIIS